MEVKKMMNTQLKVSELVDGMKRVNVNGLEVVYKSEVRNVQSKDGTKWSVQDITVRDESGMIKVPIWETENQKRIKLGTKFSVENGYVTSYEGELQLNVGKYGKIVFNGVQSELPTKTE